VVEVGTGGGLLSLLVVRLGWKIYMYIHTCTQVIGTAYCRWKLTNTMGIKQMLTKIRP
jgi:hypothetical protein